MITELSAYNRKVITVRETEASESQTYFATTREVFDMLRSRGLSIEGVGITFGGARLGKRGKNPPHHDGRCA